MANESGPANLFGASRGALEDLAGSLGHPAYRGRQLFRWLYRHRARDFAEMRNLPADLRDALQRRFEIRHPEVTARSVSNDGTVKLAVALESGHSVETVAIRNARHRVGARAGRASSEVAGPHDLSVCVSSQVGCPLACTFCRSGAIPFARNLTAGEIAAQVLLGERAVPGAARRSVVFMGMGEPLLNAGAVIDAIALMTDAEGFAIPPRRITVSTVGLPDGLARLGREAPEVGIAVSLHAGDDATRDRIVPVNRRFPIDAVFDALAALPGSKRRRLTIEYVLLGGETDREADARRLAGRLRALTTSGMKPRVNLIPFNPWQDPAPGAPHRQGSEAHAERFLAVLAGAGLVATLRRSRGGDVLAACGQLVAVRPAPASRPAVDAPVALAG